MENGPIQKTTNNDDGMSVKESGAEYRLETRGEFIQRIEKEGFVVVFPQSNELFIDIDNEEQYEIFKKHFAILQRDFKLVKVTYDGPSKSGLPRRHIIIQVPWRLRDIERIAWQAALGSDPMRELVSMLRIKREIESPTLFIEKLKGKP